VQLLGLDARHDQLAHHNIFFNAPEHYADEFDDIFQRQVPPTQPTLYVCITAKSDADHAPAGHENWFVMVNTPHLNNRFDWRTQTEAYSAQLRQQLSGRMSQLGHPDWAGHITTQHHFTPRDLQNAYGGNLGSIYGFSSNTKLAAFLRPNNRAKGLQGLYFATGSAHPGGGVPLVTLSGAAAAECLMQDMGG
jgi:phytoene dehydrogenase-like protein